MKIQYARLGKPYKFYMMFHEHGCAKTSVIKAIASKTGKHVVVLTRPLQDVVELCQTISDFAREDGIQEIVCSS
jgi:hypothetical protein